ncbi:MAG TPA: sensor domain-containing diguanylate cyclase [Actinomycetota bacterium]|nr:sensor domain-containing diguanylate cyclase [Actinomycetota bacterium]
MRAGGESRGPHRGAGSLLAFSGEWGWAGLLRIGLALTLAGTVLADPGGPARPLPVLVTVLAVAGALVVLGVAHLTPQLRSSRPAAVGLLAVDAVAVLGALALDPSPHASVHGLVVVVQAEAGVVLGLAEGVLAWLLVTGGYLAAVGAADAPGGPGPPLLAVLLRVGLGLLLCLLGGALSEVLSGEWVRRFADQERELRAAREVAVRYRRLVEGTPNVSYTADAEGRPTYVSPQLEGLLGYAPEEWVADPSLWSRAILPEDRAAVAEDRARARRAGRAFRAEYRLQARDGRILWVREEATLVGRGRSRTWHGILADITDRKRSEERAAFLAYHDALTGLPNRRMLEEVLELALARARRSGLVVAVLYVDLDRFKEVNDELGHGAGDQVLRAVARRMRSRVRDTDVVARLGGDEFVVVLADLPPGPGPGSSAEAQGVAEAVARRVLQAVARPVEVAGRSVRVGASIGVSLYPDVARDARGLLREADEAMYRSKREPERGGVVVACPRRRPAGQPGRPGGGRG